MATFAVNINDAAVPAQAACEVVTPEQSWNATGVYLTTPTETGTNYAYSTGFSVTFAQPVENLSFLEMFENCKPGSPSPYQDGKTFQIDIFEDFSPTATVSNQQHYGLTQYSTSSWGSQTIDLSAYSNITKIKIHDITDPWGLWWDDFRFDLPPSLLAATLTQHGTASNSVTVLTDAAIGQLYLAADANSAAHVDLSAAFTPEMFGSTATASQVRVIAAPDGHPESPIINLTYDYLQTHNGLSNILPTAVPGPTSSTSRSTTTPTATGNTTREWTPRGKLTFTSRRSRSRLTPTTMARSTRPTACSKSKPRRRSTRRGIPAEPRIRLSAQCGGPASNLNVLVPNVCGMEFWDAATGGNRLQVDSGGYIVNNAVPTSGQYTRTLWVSVDPTKPADFTQIAVILDPPPYIVLATAIDARRPACTNYSGRAERRHVDARE